MPLSDAEPRSLLSTLVLSPCTHNDMLVHLNWLIVYLQIWFLQAAPLLWGGRLFFTLRELRCTNGKHLSPAVSVPLVSRVGGATCASASCSTPIWGCLYFSGIPTPMGAVYHPGGGLGIAIAYRCAAGVLRSLPLRLTHDVRGGLFS